jgi:HemX protein
MHTEPIPHLMSDFASFAPSVLLLLYGLATAAYATMFFTASERARRLASPLLLLAIGAHVAYLAWLTWRWEQFPAATVSQALSVVAFAIAIIYLFLEWLGGERATGLWLVGQVFVFQLLAVVLHEPQPPRRALFEHPLFGIHVFLALVGYAAFAVAASYGFLFLRLYRELKGSHFSVFYGKLPPLEVLERMMSGALIVGFLALTAALMDGIVWAELLAVDWQHDPMILATVATWVLYGAALLLRKTRRWQGRQTALASLAGLAVIVVSLVAVHALVIGFHKSF